MRNIEVFGFSASCIRDLMVISISTDPCHCFSPCCWLLISGSPPNLANHHNQLSPSATIKQGRTGLPMANNVPGNNHQRHILLTLFPRFTQKWSTVNILSTRRTMWQLMIWFLTLEPPQSQNSLLIKLILNQRCGYWWLSASAPGHQ